ncbi:MAG: RluA family pseudouridine synthase [Pseudomonadota bacterium]
MRYQFKNLDKGRLDQVLSAEFIHISRTSIARWIKDGHVQVDGLTIKQINTKMKGGEDIVLMAPEVKPLPLKGENIDLNILYEDHDFIVVDKPAGMVVHPSAGHQQATLVHALIHHCGNSLKGIGDYMRPGIVHRLDKDTSGVMMVAKNNIMHQALSELFAKHDLTRQYLALVYGVPSPSQSSIETPIGRSNKNRLKMQAFRKDEAGAKNARYAKTDYQIIHSFALKAALVRCRLHTGKTHQIRVHMASRGHPVIGDSLYQQISVAVKYQLTHLDFKRQALHSELLSFKHPFSKEQLSFSAALPSDFKDLLLRLENEKTWPQKIER